MKHGKIKWKKFNYVCNIEEHLMIRFSITFSLHSPFTFAILLLLSFLFYITHLSFDNVLCFMPFLFFFFFLHLKSFNNGNKRYFHLSKLFARNYLEISTSSIFEMDKTLMLKKATRQTFCLLIRLNLI